MSELVESQRSALQRRAVRSDTSFGPFRFVEPMLWIVMAAILRIIAFGGGPLSLVAVLCADIAILLAFIASTRKSIEGMGGHTGIGEMSLIGQFKLSRSILWRVFGLMIGLSIAVNIRAKQEINSSFLFGLDGVAFDQSTHIGMLWSAVVATLILLMLVDAEANGGKVRLLPAMRELAHRCLWLAPAILFLGAAYMGLSFGQGLVRRLIKVYWETSSDQQFWKNLAFFVFIFSFATLRLWITLQVLTYALKQSYIREDLR